MKKFSALFLTLYLIIFPGFLTAKERRGAALVVQKKDGSQVEGELITIKKDSFLLLSNEGRDESVNLSGIDTIKIVKKSKALLGAGIGLATGVVIGAVVVSSTKIEKNDYHGFMSDIFKETGEGIVAIVAIGLAILTTLIGTGLGTTARASSPVMER